MAEFTLPQVVAFIDWEDAENSGVLTDIESDVHDALGETNVVYRKPGTDVLEGTTFMASDVDPLDLTVYTYDDDDDVNDRITALNAILTDDITTNSIDTLEA